MANLLVDKTAAAATTPLAAATTPPPAATTPLAAATTTPLAAATTPLAAATTKTITTLMTLIYRCGTMGTHQIAQHCDHLM